MLDLVPPKLYVNGFPKSGTHLAVRMALPLFPIRAVEETAWFGTNAWTVHRNKLDEAVDKFEQIRPATYLMGHTGHMPELAQLFDALKIAMLFVYRDLRDVLVSQAYHVMDDMDGKLKHPGRHLYDGMTKEEIMLACIEGIGVYSGIFERWKTYEPWFDESFIFPVRFEDMVKKPRWCAKRFFEWIYGITIAEAGATNVYLDKDLQKGVAEEMVFQMQQRQLSSTFRKGKTGSWKREFTPRVAKAFKDADTEGTMKRLNYVRSEDW